MHTFADEEDLGDLHIAQVCFGGDVGLKPGTQGFAKQISEDGKGQRQGNKQESPTSGSGPSKRRPGKSRRKNRRGNEVGSTTRVDGESAFTGFEPRHGFHCRGGYLFKLKVAEQVKAGRVGMSSHGGFMRASTFSENVKCGVFERVVAPCFKDKWEIE